MSKPLISIPLRSYRIRGTRTPDSNQAILAAKMLKAIYAWESKKAARDKTDAVAAWLGEMERKEAA